MWALLRESRGPPQSAEHDAADARWGPRPLLGRLVRRSGGERRGRLAPSDREPSAAVSWAATCSGAASGLSVSSVDSCAVQKLLVRWSPI